MCDIITRLKNKPKEVILMEPNPCEVENEYLKLILSMEVYYVRGSRKIT